VRPVAARVCRSKKSCVPQCAQKCRLAVGEDRYICGSPLVTATPSDGIKNSARKGAPDARWHIRQWQMALSIGVPRASNRIAPHRQPPVRVNSLDMCAP
jgi:hypothetical protein